jgi:hypothetical protein
MKRHINRGQFFLGVASLISVSVILTGCGGETERAAAPPDIESTTELEADSFNDSPQVGGPAQSMVRGVRVCVINKLKDRSDGAVGSVNVKFTKAENVSKEAGPINRDETVCGDHRHTSSEFDLQGTITIGYTPEVYPNDLVMDMYAWNSARSNFFDRNLVIRKPGVKGQCASTPQFAAEDWVYDDKVTRFTLQEEKATSQFKEWTITISNGESRRGSGCR